MLQRICDRCGKIIEADIRMKCDELPSNICLVHLDIGPFRTGTQGNGNIKRQVINPSETKRYELCKVCKDELMSWLTNLKMEEIDND